MHYMITLSSLNRIISSANNHLFFADRTSSFLAPLCER